MPTLVNAPKAIIDTNVLVEAVFTTGSHHIKAFSLLDRAQKGELILCLIPQVLAEFYSVTTDKRRVTTPFILSTVRIL